MVQCTLEVTQAAPASCFSVLITSQRAQIRELPGYPDIAVAQWIREDDFVPRYNIAPNTNAPVIRQCQTGNAGALTIHPESEPKDSTCTSLVMQTMRWGIHYGREPASKGSQAINARCENIIEGVGMWNKFRGKNRCIVVAQGYYEWQTKGKDKLPHFIKHPDGKVMLMAGLYDETIDKSQSQPAYTFTIVTTDAGKSLSWLHDRQPVIFSTVEEINQWLDTSQVWSTHLARLLRPWEGAKGTIQCYQVPKEVGKVGAESATFIEPVANRKDGIMAMFAKQKSKQKEASAKRQRSSTPELPHAISGEVFKKEEHEEKKLKLG